MIEYVKKKGKDISLPKNIQQVGYQDAEKRVYIEDYAFSFIKDSMMDSEDDSRVGILFGEVFEKDGLEYTFIKGAIEVINVSVYEGTVTFTEETWKSIEADKRQYFPNLHIVGWFLNSDSINPKENISIERTHMDSIGREAVFFYINPSEQVADAYACIDAGLKMLDGYMVYFDQNDDMQAYIADSAEKLGTGSNETDTVRKYRQMLKESDAAPRVRNQLSIMYGLSAILVIVVLVIGANKLNTGAGLADAGETTTEEQEYFAEETQPVNAGVADIEDETLNIDYAEGNVTTTAAVIEPVTEPSATEDTKPATEPEGQPSTETEAPIETQEATTAETTTAETTTVQETTTAPPETQVPTHEVYVVQEGDTLYKILNKFYGSTDKLQALFDLNGITDNGDSIDVGDELLLP